MFNLFKKEAEIVNGLVILRKDNENQIVDDLMVVDTLLGNDSYRTAMMAQRITRGAGSAVRVTVTTDRDTWNRIKNSKINLIATSELK